MEEHEYPWGDIPPNDDVSLEEERLLEVQTCPVCHCKHHTDGGEICSLYCLRIAQKDDVKKSCCLNAQVCFAVGPESRTNAIMDNAQLELIIKLKNEGVKIRANATAEQ